MTSTMDPNRKVSETLDRLFASLEAGVSVRVLEIACGSGAGTETAYRRLMARRPGRETRLISFDVDLASLDAARRRLAGAGCPRTSLLAADLYRLPLAAASVDYAVAFNIFHAVDRRRFAREVHRVLRPGGALLTCDRVPELPVPHLSMVLDRERLGMIAGSPRLEPEGAHS